MQARFLDAVKTFSRKKFNDEGMSYENEDAANASSRGNPLRREVFALFVTHICRRVEHSVSALGARKQAGESSPTDLIESNRSSEHA